MHERLCDFYEIFGTDIERTPRHERRMNEWVRTKKSRVKKKEAWRLLFGKDTLEEIVERINRVWIDPEYKLVLETYRALRVRLKSVK